MLVLFLSLLLTLEEKVGQLFMVHFVGQELNDNAERLIDEAHVGGFILYNWANTLESPEKVKKLTDDLQKKSPILLFIAVDQEGGPVCRLPFERPASNQESGDPQKAYKQALTIASQLKTCGINFNLGPVADVSRAAGINPARCYSSDEVVVAACVKEALRAYRAEGLIASLKHFPGHGAVLIDSHCGLPSIDTIDERDLLAFEGADVIMTGHIIVKDIDPLYPTTHSAKVLQGLLREKLHFEGVIISDSLVMKGSLEVFPHLEDSCKAALLAGCDILLFGGQDLQTVGRNELTVDEILSAYFAVIKAVKSGEIPESRIDEAASRVLQLKKKYLSYG